MKSKNIIKACILLSAALLLLLSAGCASKDEQAKLLVFSENNETMAGAYELKIDLSEGTLTLAEEPLYQVQKNTVSENYDWNTIYPKSLTDSNMVLRGEPFKAFRTPYVIIREEEHTDEGVSFKQLWSGEYRMDYTAGEKSETYEIKKSEEAVAVLTAEIIEDERFEPLIFFIDKAGKLVMVCTRTKGAVASNNYPVSVVAAKNEDGKYEVAEKTSFERMYEERFSPIQGPYSCWFGENIYADADEECFYWNEGCNIVKMNPYDGSFDIVVNVSDIERDIPTLDTNREEYDFIYNYGHRNGINILIFPNYNDLPGMIAAFYNDEGAFLGRVLVSEDSIICFDKGNKEKSRLEGNNFLSTFLYAPLN